MYRLLVPPPLTRIVRNSAMDLRITSAIGTPARTCIGIERHSLRSRSRSFSANANRDTRLAGRRRFYKVVGVIPADAPWEDLSAPAITVDNPISAGVDGTQSAAGVERVLAPRDIRKERLMPRKPGFFPDINSTSDQTSPKQSVGWFAVTLDGRIVKTPMGQTLAVPSEMLAWAIAAEWDAQEISLQPAQMPLMTLACTALDQTASAPHVAKTNSMIYLPTDTICYWADPTEDRILHRRQQEAWDEILQHTQEILGDRPAIAMGANEGLVMSRVRGQKSIGLPHPEKVLDGAQAFIDSLDAWHLTALFSVTSEAKSLLVGTALLAGKTPPVKAVDAARVEEEFQISIASSHDIAHPLDLIFNTTEDLGELSDNANSPMTQQLMIDIVYVIFAKQLILQQHLRVWNRRPSPERTWTSMLTHFRDAQLDLSALRTSGALYHQQPVHHHANNVETMADLVAQRLLDAVQPAINQFFLLENRVFAADYPRQ